MPTARELAEKLGDILDPALREVTATPPEAFRPYDRYGEPVEGMHWLPLSVDKDDDLDIFLLRMDPGAQSRPHEHVDTEQFLVIDGALIDCDGTIIPTGSFARFEAGSTHHSHTEEGCLLLSILRTRNRGLDEEGN